MFIQKSIYQTIVSKFVRPNFYLKYKIICLEANYSDSIFDIKLSLTQDQIFEIKNFDNCILLIDNTFEGYSYLHLNFYKIIHSFLNENEINSKKIFFISSNILEEQSYNTWASSNVSTQINVLSFDYWSWIIKSRGPNPITIDETVKNFKEKKYFLSLNRVKRLHRTLTIYKIFCSKILSSTNISYTKFFNEDFDLLKNYTETTELKKMIDSSPKILDRSDFEVNWAEYFNQNLFMSSIISLVTETLYEHSDTSLFYSEKTFKPMLYNHPVFIFGQQNSNLGLEKIGYKPYSSYFNFSFDKVEDVNERFDLQINYLEKLADKLDRMNINQQIDWVMLDIDTINYNKEMIREQSYNKSQGFKFLKILETL